jgi:hypothetical protein
MRFKRPLRGRKLSRLYRVYPEAETYLKRARFYAGAQEVRWLLRGIEANDP